MTLVDEVSPVESLTVSVIRYRVLPLKSWPLVGIVNVPLFTPVTGVPGWTWPSWRKSMFQVKALAGSVPSSGSVPVPPKLITSLATKCAPSVGDVMVGSAADRPLMRDRRRMCALLAPSDTVSRAWYVPAGCRRGVGLASVEVTLSPKSHA